jgi:hypothetical protein
VSLTVVLSLLGIEDRALVSSYYLTVGPSSSHTVGPMRAGKIFVNDLVELGLLDKVSVVLCVGQRSNSKSFRSELLKYRCMPFILFVAKNVNKYNSYGSLAATGAWK